MTELITAVLMQLLRDAGYHQVTQPPGQDDTVQFTCALEQQYTLRLRGCMVVGYDPCGGRMEQWDLNDPASLDQIMGWCRYLRAHWRWAKLMLAGYSRASRSWPPPVSE